jgi:hypothetical protein
MQSPVNLLRQLTRDGFYLDDALANGLRAGDDYSMLSDDYRLALGNDHRVLVLR